MSLIFPIALFVLIFYFLIFRPQKKKQQEHEKMVASIGIGDTVVSAGGFFGRVSSIMDDSYIIEIADGVKVRILKTSISIRRTESEGGARPDRPRRKKRKKPVGAGETAQNGAEIAAEGENVGVTPAENAALIDEAEEEEAQPMASDEAAE